MKYIILYILLSIYGCAENHPIDLNFTIQILEKNKFIYTIESSKNGSSLKWIKKYDKDFKLIKEYELRDYGSIVKIDGDTIFFHLYISQRNFIPSNSNVEKWGDEYVKIEKINILGYLTEKKLNVNDFEILNNECVFVTTNFGKYHILISDIKCGNNEFFTQRRDEQELLSIKIRFTDKNLKNKFTSALFKYWKKKLS